MEYLQTCGLSQQSMSNADIAYNKEIQITKRLKKKTLKYILTSKMTWIAFNTPLFVGLRHT
jgi:hypothetical protein